MHDVISAVAPTAAAGDGGSGSVTLLVIFITLAIGVSFLSSVMEAVLLSVSPAYVGALEADNPQAAGRFRELKSDVDRPLAAILTPNTVAHTIGAPGTGAEAAAVFGSAAIGIFSAVLTLGILVLSEIIPKTLGAVYWRGLAPLVAVMLKPLIYLLYPLVWMSQWFAKLLTRGERGGDVSREELAALADIGAEEGVFQHGEARLFKSLLRFESLRVSDVMTTRAVVVAFTEATTVDQLVDAGHPFSRYPVYAESRDAITGNPNPVTPVYAVPKLLKRHGLTVDDIDIWELNEAFASQCLYSRDQLGIDPDKYNVNGGSIAIGHPFGMTGTRCAGHLLQECKRRGARWGVVTMCIGGGQGAAGLIEIYS